MLKRVKTQTGPGPLIGGRSAFRGVINPLILAGGKYGQSPDIWAAEYANAEPSPVAVQQQKITIVNPAPELCPTSQNLKDWCDQTGNQMGFCKKRTLVASSSECASIQEPECPRSAKLMKEVCNLYNSPYMDFCKGYKINGQCYEEAIKQDEEEIRLEKEAQDKRNKEEADAKAKADAERETNWKVTRGCRYNNFPLQVGVNNSFIQTPCPFGTGDDNKPGQIKLYGGKQYKFISWSPEQP